MILNFDVTNQILRRLDKNVLVSKSKNYISCNFKFKTSDWEGIEKFAIFKDSWGDAYNLHLGLECDVTIVPPEEVLRGNFFKVSVYGGDRITSDEKTVAIIPSGYTTKIKMPGESAADVFTQIFDALDGKVSEITYDDDGYMRIYSNQGEVNVIKLINLSDLSNVATSGSYKDLVDVPETFPPEEHDHLSEDILDLQSNVEGDINLLLIQLTDKIIEM